MTRLKTSTTITSNPSEGIHSDPETANASIFRDALSEQVIKCFVAERSKKREESAKEKRLKRKKKKKAQNSSRKKETRERERENEDITESKEGDGDNGDDDDDDDNNEQNEESEIEDLGDFIDYLSSEIFASLPDDLRSLTYTAIQEDESLASRYVLPVSNSTVEDIATRCLSPSIVDSLLTYNLIFNPIPTTITKSSHQYKNNDLTAFLYPILTSYITSTSTLSRDPSSGISTACEFCLRDWIPLTYHHLIPRSTHARVLKRGWHRPEMLNIVAWLCRPCHDTVHRVVPSNEELARHWYTVDLLMQRDDVRSFVGWVGRIRGLAR